MRRVRAEPSKTGCVATNFLATHFLATTVLAAMLLVTLAACTRDQQGAPTFTLRLEPATATVHKTESVAVTVTIIRVAGFAAPVEVSVGGGVGGAPGGGGGGDVPGVTASPITVTGEQGTLEVNVTDDASAGTVFVPITARSGTRGSGTGSSGSVERTETLTLRVAEAVPRVGGLDRPGLGSSGEVRQGYGNIGLVVTGTNLDRHTTVELGGLAVSVAEVTPERLTLTAVVPHGAAAGPKDLVLGSAGGQTTYAGALEVTPITAGPDGNDEKGGGTTASPYRTLSQALTVAGPGDTVRLLPGTYGAEESWPTQAGAGATPNVPEGVRVVGDDGQLVALEGAPSEVGLWFAGPGAAANLRLVGFGAGVRVTGGAVALDRLAVANARVGVAVTGGEVRMNESTFSANESAAVAVSGSAHVRMSGGAACGGGLYGVTVKGEATFEAAGAEFSGNEEAGIRAEGSSRLVLTDVRVDGNASHGLMAGDDVSAVITGGEFTRNALNGLWFGGSTLRLRGATLTDNEMYGLYVTNAPARVDLGTFREPGDNVFGGSQYVHVVDGRPEREYLEAPIIFTLSAATFDGAALAATVLVGPLSEAGFPISIINANNVVQVY